VMVLVVLLCRREREMQRKEAEEARARKKLAFLRYGRCYRHANTQCWSER
jgi:hypothetical protein